MSHTELPQLSGPFGFSSANNVSFSADGRFVAFESTHPLVGNDEGNDSDIFLFDRELGTLRLVSRSFGDARMAVGASSRPKVSADGSAVAFISLATNLVPGADSGLTSIYLWRRSTGVVSLVSRAEGGGNANGSSGSFFLSADGSKVAFTSNATDLNGSLTDNNGVADAFLWSETDDSITLLSRSNASPNTTADGGSGPAGMSEAGDAVLILSGASNLIDGFIDQNSGGTDYYFWRTGGTVELITQSVNALGGVSGSSGNPGTAKLSADGSAVTLTHAGADLVSGFVPGGGSLNVFQWLEATGSMQLVSHVADNVLGGANGSSSRIVSSADGSVVAFDSQASDLVDSDGNSQTDVFRWQRQDNTVELISRQALLPSSANSQSRSPSISRDGQTLTFVSRATDLIENFIAPASDNQVYAWQQGQGNVLVSRSTAGANVGADDSFETPKVDPAGAFVYFVGFRVDDLIEGFDDGLFSFELATETIRIVSTASFPETLLLASDEQTTERAALSADGRYIAFASSARHLIEGFVKGSGIEDVFLWDRETGEVRLVSRSVEGPLVGGSSHSRDPVISADGRYVAFLSNATDLIPNFVPGPFRQLYLWDRDTSEITLISHVAGSPSTASAGGVTRDPVITADGSTVVFVSSSDDLIPGFSDTNGGGDIFSWDRTSDELTLVSRSAAVPNSAGNESAGNNFSVSEDGSRIAFRSGATDLNPAITDTNGRRDAFVWDRDTDSVTLISHVAGDPLTAAERASDDVVINGDGNMVAFTSSGSDLVAGVDGDNWLNIYVRDLATATTTWVTRSLLTPGISGEADSGQEMIFSKDGSLLAFLSRRMDMVPQTIPPFVQQLYVWRRVLDEVSLISRSVAGNTGVDASSARLSMSDSGLLAFETSASNIFDGTENNFSNDIFSWDPTTGRVSLVSHVLGDENQTGTQGSDWSSYSADGSAIAFNSRASEYINGRISGQQTFLSLADTAADLGATLAAPDFPVPTGEIYEYQLAAENLSIHNATHAMAVLTLPARESFVETIGDDWACRFVNSVLACRRSGAIPAGVSTAPLTVRLRAPDLAGTSGLEALLQWPGTDPDGSNNRVTAETVFAPDDWGDAPAPYPTLAANNGASHGFSELFLGSVVNVDVDGQPSAGADGDDTDGTEDEDGVDFVAPIVIAETGQVEVVASAPGTLDAFFDWNQDGDWNDAGEKALDGVAVVAGAQSLALSVPADAERGETLARFRLSSAGIAGATGRADDGEVEDYAVQVEAIGLSTTVEAAPTLIPEVGGDVTFTVAITNTGSQNATLTALSDDLFGSVDGEGSCAVPQVIAAGATYACAYTLNLSGPVDATETHTVNGGADSLGFTLTASDSAAVTFFDSIAPGLTGYAASPSAGETLIDCATLRSAPQQLSITFSEELAIGSGGADDAASYRLFSTGPDLSFETIGCEPTAASDAVVPFNLSYQPGADRFDPSVATLQAPLADGLYRLAVCSGLEDLGANALPGGDQVIGFRVDAGNLLRNGHFDCDIAAWQQDPAEPEIAHAPLDSEGSSESGSLLIGGEAEGSFGLGQCFAAGDELDFTFDVDLRLDAAGGQILGLARSCLFYSDGSCQAQISEAASIDVLTDTGGAFTPRGFALHSPLGTQSMECRFDVEALSGPFELYLDQARVVIESSIFEDGFESGNTSSWSGVQP